MDLVDRWHKAIEKRPQTLVPIAVAAIGLSLISQAVAQENVPLGFDVSASFGAEAAPSTFTVPADLPLSDIGGAPIKIADGPVLPTAPSCREAYDAPTAMAALGFDDFPGSPINHSAEMAHTCFSNAWSVDGVSGSGASSFALEFAPGQTVCEDGSCEGRQFSSRLQFDLERLVDIDGKDRGIFLFAGADDKALMWRPTAKSGAPSDPRILVNDSVTVGDVEAGVTFVGKHAEISMSYMHRETSYYVDRDERLSDSEDYVGIVLRLD